MYLVKTPKFIQSLFPNFTWRVPTREKTLYLTFDDGPIPEVTPWVLDQLSERGAKATFFCVGDNIQKYPEVFQMLLDSNQTVGNHTYHHLNGWKTENVRYFLDIRRGARLAKSELFRPPYGRMMPRQVQFLQRHYRIVMWDVLSGDFDPQLTAEQCLENVLSNAGPGSIVVFHDSLKAKDKLQYVLPKVLDHFAAQGYTFEKLSEKALSQPREVENIAC
ncbi:MAG: polysaccharide deacetylase family protein [Saprospiraceae bacterium]|nr:polysaccharide deacetylase family protein [Saprospiraceae bacterium]